MHDIGFALISDKPLCFHSFMPIDDADIVFFAKCQVCDIYSP